MCAPCVLCAATCKLCSRCSHDLKLEYSIWDGERTKEVGKLTMMYPCEYTTFAPCNCCFAKPYAISKPPKGASEDDKKNIFGGVFHFLANAY